MRAAAAGVGDRDVVVAEDPAAGDVPGRGESGRSGPVITPALAACGHLNAKD